MKIQTIDGLRDTSELTRGYSSVTLEGNIALYTNWYTKITKRLVRRDVQYYVDETVLNKPFKFMLNCNSIRALQVDGAPIVSISLPTTTKYNIGIADINLDSGFGYIVDGPFGTIADTDANPTQSLLRVFENGAELTGHTDIATVESTGLGIFKHWSMPDGTQEKLIFSTTDNSDPRFNGRSYTYAYVQIAPDPNPVPDPGPAPAPGAPTIISITPSDITQTSITITVVLNMVAQLYIQYGLTSLYGQESVHEDSLLYSTHIQTLSGLIPGQKYHFRVRATNGGETISPDNIFTLAVSDAITISPITETEATVVFTTSVPGENIIEVGTTTAYGTNVTTGVSAQFSNITATPASTSATISWDLSELATGQVEYGTTELYGTLSTQAGNLTHHSQVLSGLTPATLYHYRLISIDQSTNTSYSMDYTFTTNS
jgi:hypothetical protein